MLACDKEAIVEATASCMRRPLPVKCKGNDVFKSSTASESRGFPISQSAVPSFPQTPRVILGKFDWDKDSLFSE